MSARRLFAMSWALASLSGAACKNEPPAQAPENVERTVFAGQRCPELALGAEPLDPANARVFVELVEVSAPPLPSPLGRFLDEHAVTTRASAHLVAFPGVPTSAPWAQCVDAVCAGSPRSVHVTARLPALTSTPIGLELRIEQAPAGGAGSAPELLLEARVEAPHQEPVVVPSTPELGGGALLVSAYLLRRFDDLQRVLTCQERQKARRPER